MPFSAIPSCRSDPDTRARTVYHPARVTKLRDLSAEDIDRWLAAKATTLSTRSLQAVHSCLDRSVKRAMTRDKVKRNVVELCSVPQSQAGLPSKALTWDHVFLKGKLDAEPPQPRTSRCGARSGAAETPRLGSPGAPSLCRRAFRQALKDVDGISAEERTPPELRHSFVSLRSDRGVPLEEISRLVGHSGTAVTEEVYRKQIRPVIQTGAVVMDGIFGAVQQRW